ncbi:MAG TPA: MotA/TolQ/ExbB proton channel family protein [Macromonas sp.]|nr:MotA/TolQ/ExbB proton channel family protein [Macromonas sp.]
MIGSTQPTPGRLLRFACVLVCLGAGAAYSLGAQESLPAAAQAMAPVAAAAQRMGILEMFLHADWVVKAVMLFLLLCSVATWTLLLDKAWLLHRIGRHSERFLASVRTAQRVDQIGPLARKHPDTPLARIWLAAQKEWDGFHHRQGKRPTAPHQADRLLQRMALAAGIAQEQELARLGNGMGVLATIGSTAPFVGLFGTVWGILHSFADIAAAKTTSLSVVAPGIAEALLATAIGLFAAIPAVMIYNGFARSISRLTGAFDNFVAEFTTFASRELEQREEA